MIAPNKARPIGRAFFAYSGIDFAALRRDARCCLPREWSHFKAICAAGEPEGARPASDEIFASPQGNAFCLPREWSHFKAICAAGEPEGARPASDEMFASPQGNAFCLPREWSHFIAICAAGGSPRGQGPPRMRCLHRRKAMPSPCQENGLISKPFAPQGEPEGARPASDEMFASPQGDAFSLPREWSHFIAICAAGEPEGARPASDEMSASPQGDAPVTPPALPRCGSRRGSICRSAAAADTERSARSRRWT